MAGRPLRRARENRARNNSFDWEKPRPPTYTTAKPATVRLAKMVGEACRLDETVALPTDNFWYAWLLAALARGVVRNETHDKYTASLADMTLRQIAAMADSDVSFYDT